MKLLILFLFVAGFIYGMYELDKYMKEKAIKEDVNQDITFGRLSFDNQTLLNNDDKVKVIIRSDNTFYVKVNN